MVLPCDGFENILLFFFFEFVPNPFDSKYAGVTAFCREGCTLFSSVFAPNAICNAAQTEENLIVTANPVRKMYQTPT